MNDDLEHTLRDSLDRHAAGAGGSGGSLDDVYHRVDRQRARRRSVAVFGSIAVVAVGVVGVAAVSNDDDSAPSLAGALGDAATDGPTTTTAGYAVAGGETWSCAGYLGTDGWREYYSDCFPTGAQSIPPECFAPPTTVAYAIDELATTTTSTTTIPPELNTGQLNTGQPVVTTIAVGWCGDASPYYDPACVPPATTAPADTAIGTPPDMTAPAIACAVASTTTYAEPPTTASWPSQPPATSSPGEPVDCTANAGVTAPPTSIPTTDMQAYTVVANDSLVRIAALFDVSPEIIANFNGWDDCLDHVLFVGDLVLIPPGARVPSG